MQCMLMVPAFFSERRKNIKNIIKKNIVLRTPIFPLRKCPFCGAAAEVKSEKDASGKRLYFVECVQCKARTKGHRLLSAAVEHWDKQIYDTKQRKGKWLCKKDDDGYYIECSVCHVEYGYLEQEEPPYSKFCPECSARLMQTEQKGERKISIDDYVESAERIKTKKKEKDRNDEVETYRRQELAEVFLRKMIGIEDDEEEETDENG